MAVLDSPPRGTAAQLKLLKFLFLAALCDVPWFPRVRAISGNGSSTFDAGRFSGKSLQNQLVQALKQEGGYTAAATFLGSLDLNHLLPESSTILVPMDQGLADAGLQFSTFNTAVPILQYHVIPQRLVFHDLQQMSVGQTLETLLQNNTVIITNNSTRNFAINDVAMSRRNLFVASSTVLHGMNGVLNYAVYGRITRLHEFPPSSPPRTSTDPGSGLPLRQPTPPPTGHNNSDESGGKNDDDTDTAPFPTGNDNIPLPPTTNAPPALQAGNASTVPLPLSPISKAPSKPDLNQTSGSQQTDVPDNSGQQSSPLLQSGCVPSDDRICAPIASSYQVKSSRSQLLSCIVVTISGVCLLHGLTIILKLPQLFVFLALTMAATTVMGENKDIPDILWSKEGFDYAAAYLKAIDMHRLLPNKSTLFVPTDAALESTGLIYKTLGAALPTLRYHVITRKLSFKELQMLPVGETLETMLPNYSLQVTNNAPSNFSLNDVLVSHPDLFYLSASAIHGIDGVMNYSHVHLSIASPVPNDEGFPLRTPPVVRQPVLPLPDSTVPLPMPFPASCADVLQREIIRSCELMIVEILSFRIGLRPLYVR